MAVQTYLSHSIRQFRSARVLLWRSMAQVRRGHVIHSPLSLAEHRRRIEDLSRSLAVLTSR